MARRHSSLLAAALAAGVTTLAAAPRARADTTPEMRAAAAALFDEGRRLMAAGNYVEACPKLEESQHIDPGMGTRFNLASCHEATGRTASAWIGFRDVADEAAQAGQPEREKAARARASALEGKLTRLQLKLHGAIPGLEVRRDGIVLAPALWSTPFPLDPGPHKLAVSAPGKETWETTVRLDQPGATVAVDVPALADKAFSSGGAIPELPGPRADDTPPPGPSSSPRRWQMPLGVTLTVVGVGGMAGGIALAMIAKSGFNDSNQGNCSATTNQCNAAGLSQRSSAVSKGNAATGLFVAGGVLGAAGVVVWVTAPRAAAPAIGAIGVGPRGVELRRAW